MQITLEVISPDPGILGEASLRTLTINAGESTPICRSSSDPNKNLIPTADNAIFGSKVMSREHAYLEAPTAYPGPLMITDTSKYGTFVNNKRIPKLCATRLQSGDRIKFGDTVNTSASDITHRPLECVVLYTHYATIPESHVSDSLGNNHFSADVYSDDNGSEHEEVYFEGDVEADEDNDHSSQRSASCASQASSVKMPSSSPISPPTPHPATHLAKEECIDTFDYPDEHASYADGAEVDDSNEINEVDDSNEINEVDELGEDEADVFADGPSSDGWLDGPVPEVSQRVLPPAPQMSRKTRWDMSPGDVITTSTDFSPLSTISPVQPPPASQHVSAPVLTCPSFVELFHSLLPGTGVDKNTKVNQRSHDKRTSIQYLIDDAPENVLPANEESYSKECHTKPSSGSASACPDDVIVSAAPQTKTEIPAEDQGEESDPVRPRKAELPQRLLRKKGKLVAKKNHSKLGGGRAYRVMRKSTAEASPTATFRSMLSTAMTASAYAAVGSIATIGFLASPLAERLAGL